MRLAILIGYGLILAALVIGAGAVGIAVWVIRGTED